MSDFEDDEMDVDGDAVQDSMAFSASNTDAKGKRSAADLPVELVDSLPWYGQDRPRASLYQLPLNRCRVEKYRPNTLDDVSGHKDILATINKFVEANVRVAA